MLLGLEVNMDRLAQLRSMLNATPICDRILLEGAWNAPALRWAAGIINWEYVAG